MYYCTQFRRTENIQIYWLGAHSSKGASPRHELGKQQRQISHAIEHIICV